MFKRVLLIIVLVALVAGIIVWRKDINDGDISQNGNDVVGEINEGDNEENNKESLPNSNDTVNGTAEDKNGEKGEDKNSIGTEYELTEEGIIKPEFAKRIIKRSSDKLIRAIGSKDFGTVSKFTHPNKGVRFTPYTTVSLKQDIVFEPREIKDFFNNQNVYVWGLYDGRGNEISLTPSQYYEEFIYTEDFINAEETGYNEVLGGGNSVENQFEVYDNAIVVEYYFPGLNPDYGGTDWKSLRLVFEQYEDDWKLVGIIHNQWTI